MTALDSPSTSRPLRALVVDAAPEVAGLLEALLSSEGFDVAVVNDADAAVTVAREFGPDVIVLDVVLPGADGLEACRRIRTFSDAYVVVVSVRDDEPDRLRGLSVGADDYLGKPFSPYELVARIRAMLRRPRPLNDGVRLRADGSPAIKTFGDLVIDLDARQVTLGDKPVNLTRIEFNLLAVLCAQPGSVLSRGRLLELVWGPNWYVNTHVVVVHV